MAKFRIIPESETINQLQFWCPGCQLIHSLNTTWTFNGDLNSPTISPSLMVRGVKKSTNTLKYPHGEPYVCHSLINKGEITFLNDSSHFLAGQTVMIPEVDDKP